MSYVNEEHVEKKETIFRLRCQKYFLTYKHWIKKQWMKNFLENIVPDRSVKLCYVAHETGHENAENEHSGYKHTHVLVWFDKALSIQSKNAQQTFDISYSKGKEALVDWEEIRDELAQQWEQNTCPCCIIDGVEQHSPLTHIHPNIIFLKRKDEWNKRLHYISKEDKECKDEIERDKKPSVAESISKCNSEQEVLESINSFGDVTGALQAFKILNKPEIQGITRPQYRWVDTLIDEIWNDSYFVNHRTIIWIYDRVGNSGKTYFTKWAYQELGRSVYAVATLGSNRDFATVIEGAVASGWTGETFIADLPRSAENRQIYETLEAIKNGFMTSVKYQGKTFQFDIKRCIIFANFMPEVHKMSKDRWRIFDLSEAKELKFTNASEAEAIRQQDLAFAFGGYQNQVINWHPPAHAEWPWKPSTDV